MAEQGEHGIEEAPTLVLVRIVTPHIRGPNRLGELKWLTESQAAVLVQMGHAQYVDSTANRAPETTMLEPPENAMRPRGRARRVR